MPLEGARPSPNIWGDPVAYEMENRAFDRTGALWRHMREIADWADLDVLDVGCGAGFHLPVAAEAARTVTGVEPHPGLAGLARRRTRRLTSVRVVEGLADNLPLPDDSVDMAYARWAYFFGPGCEPGIRELARVLRPGGHAFVLDNDPTRSTFGRWFACGFPEMDAKRVETFWGDQGWSRLRLDLAWEFEERSDLETVVRLELPPETASDALREQVGLTVDYAVNLWHRGY